MDICKKAEYLDRLPYEKLEQLRAVIGTSELGWSDKFPRLSQKKKLEVGRITFGCEVKNVTMKFECDAATGFDLPIIIADDIS